MGLTREDLGLLLQIVNAAGITGRDAEAIAQLKQKLVQEIQAGAVRAAAPPDK